MTLDATTAAAFAGAWIAAWNAHDLEAIVGHYAGAVEFESPFVRVVTGESSGRLHGRDALRAYFAVGLQRCPDMLFTGATVYVGAESLVIAYTSTFGGSSRAAAETMTLDASERAVRVQCHYR